MSAKKRFDSMQYGLVPGIILPLIGLIIVWAVRFDGGLLEFLKQFQQSRMLPKLLSLLAIPNLVLFFLFIWTNRSFSARGVIFATFVLAFVMLVLKLA